MIQQRIAAAMAVQRQPRPVKLNTAPDGRGELGRGVGVGELGQHEATDALGRERADRQPHRGGAPRQLLDPVEEQKPEVPRRLGGRRVVIVVEPRLLSETLARALERSDADVTIGLDPPIEDDERFDIAIVTGDVPPDLHADVVVRVPDGEADEG